MNLLEHLEAERGRTKRIAGELAMSPAFLSQIARGGRPCPPERAVELERTTAGHVRRWDLRPDDWHRIWPELIGTEGAPPLPATQEVA